MGLPDLGIAPALVNTPYSAAYTMGSAGFNTALTQLICDLNAEFPHVKFYMSDTFELLQYAVENGEALGFTNVDGADGAATNYDGYLFWDGIHPTTATHKYLAALALGQVKQGKASKEMKDMLHELNPIHPRTPYVVHCFD